MENIGIEVAEYERLKKNVLYVKYSKICPGSQHCGDGWIKEKPG